MLRRRILTPMSSDSTEKPRAREIERIIKAHSQHEGGGFVVRRPIPTAGLEHLDPFLLVDEMGPIDYLPGQAMGAPDHPHRGFETVSYLLEGEMEHADSAGHRGVIRPGGVQWMTAGAGIVHAEMPSRRMQEQGGRAHGFQIWVNLPARLKLTRTRYQELAPDQIPEAESPDGLCKVRIIAGSALGKSAAIDTHTPIVYQDWTVAPGGAVTLPIPTDHRLLVYVFGGMVHVGDQGRTVDDGHLALLGPGELLRMRVPTTGVTARALVLAGVPHGDPIVRYGPCVMNSRDELAQAFEDYRSGRLGEITRSAELVDTAATKH